MRETYVLILLILLALAPVVYGIRAEIGNARTIINTDWEGEKTIERAILVRNVNDVPVDIDLRASEEIEDIIELIDKEFRLEPGEEKKARFDIVLKKPGEWAGKIFVRFTPELGNSIVLSSALILGAGANEGVEIPSDEDEDEDLAEILDDDLDFGDDEEDSGLSGNAVGFGVGKPKNDNGSIFTPYLTILMIVLSIIVVIVIAGGVYLLKK